MSYTISSKVINQSTLLCTMQEYNDWMHCLLKQAGLVIIASDPTDPNHKEMRMGFALELKAYIKNAGSRLSVSQGGLDGAVFTRSGMPKGNTDPIPFGLDQNLVGDLQILRAKAMQLLTRMNVIYPGEGFAVDMKGGAKKSSSKKRSSKKSSSKKSSSKKSSSKKSSSNKRFSKK